MAGTTRVEKVIKAAMALSKEERAQVAFRLLDAADAPDPQAGLDDEAWVAEIAKRADEVLSGRVKTIPWTRVRADRARRRKR